MALPPAASSAGATLTALRDALAQAAADGFAGVGDATLGAKLRDLADRASPQPEAGGWSEMREALRHFDRLGKHDRSVIIAKAMRICLALTPVVKATPKRSPRRQVAVGSAKDARESGRRAGTPPKPGRGAHQASDAGTGYRATGPADTETTAAAPPCDVLPGIGPSTAAKLGARGLHTLEDLVYTLPTAYYDLRQTAALDAVADGDVVVVRGTIASFKQGFFSGRYLATLEVEVDHGPDVQARWFHRGGLPGRVVTGDPIVLVGPVKTFRDRPSMVHPDVYGPDAAPPAILVKYPAVEGIGAKALARACQRALAHGCTHGWLTDVLPPAVAQAHALPPLDEALHALHAPDPALSPEAVAALRAGSSPAHRRLAFEEFFVLQLSLARQRHAYRDAPVARVIPESAFDRERLRACLPFEPTSGQWSAIGEIAADMETGTPMLRLLQGDVGSGKTAVAFAAALAVAQSGAQTGLMAPTEILAEQHGKTLRPWCEAAGLKVAVLTGRMGKGERQSLLALLGAGAIDILVGTHALIVGDVHFRDLGLAVVDEQHRFGVEQRATLRDKGGRPHLLVMTATPIPRTLALCSYGELDVSVIDGLPPGREAPVTRLYHGGAGLKRARAVMAGAVGRGSKAFVVCPLVEASDAVAASDVEATAAAVQAMLPEHRVGLVHGRMSSAEKDAVMEAFRSAQIHVLVATTVIEVGVDVPDARLILVEHAERFGLSQLHQLRGRVGRGGGACACLVHTSAPKQSETAGRLEVLAQTHDGFVVAERDLALRGPGELFGARQAGVPRLRFSGFGGEGTRMLVAAREAAQAWIGRDPTLSDAPELRALLDRRERGAAIYSGEAG